MCCYQIKIRVLVLILRQVSMQQLGLIRFHPNDHMTAISTLTINPLRPLPLPTSSPSPPSQPPFPQPNQQHLFLPSPPSLFPLPHFPTSFFPPPTPAPSPLSQMLYPMDTSPTQQISPTHSNPTYHPTTWVATLVASREGSGRKRDGHFRESSHSIVSLKRNSPTCCFDIFAA